MSESAQSSPDDNATMSGAEPENEELRADRAWAPLLIPAYRGFWIAGLISNLGTWVHETGAQWLMATLDPSPHMVAAVRTAMTAPVFFLALPAGVWADQMDRRRWLLAAQLLLLVVASAMAVLAGAGWMTPSLLLVLTAAMGVGMVLNQPAWQSITPELVSPAMIPAAVSIGSFSFNLGRTIGPALAGILIARFSVWIAFAFNALSFLAVIVVLWRWRPEQQQRDQPPRAFVEELRAGLETVYRVIAVRHVMLRLLGFALPASVLWSLLALVAKEKLEFAERGFGFSLALVGSGAAIGAWMITSIRARVGSDGILLGAQVIFGTLCVLIGVADHRGLLLPALVVTGACWMAVMTTLNATAQVYLPRQYRARGMATYMMTFALGTAAGSAIWGWYARYTSLDAAYAVAGGCLILTALTLHRLTLGDMRHEFAR